MRKGQALMENLYHSLGINQDADHDAITDAYESLYLFYHSAEYQSKFADIDIKLANIAVSYEILKCATKRKSYDDMWQLYLAEKSLAALVDIPDMSYEFEVDSVVMEHWREVTNKYPQLNELYESLACLSTVLAYSFKAYILDSQRYEESERLAYIMCAQYIQKFFGEDQNIKPLAEGLLAATSPSDSVTTDELFDAQGIEVNFQTVADTETEIILLSEPVTQMSAQSKAELKKLARTKAKKKLKARIMAKSKGMTKPISTAEHLAKKQTQAQTQVLSIITPKISAPFEANQPQLTEKSDPKNEQELGMSANKNSHFDTTQSHMERLLASESRQLRHSTKKATAKGSLILFGLFLVSSLAA